MRWQEVRNEKMVTWGKGTVFAKIIALDPKDQTCRLITVNENVGPCGRKFPVGLEFTMAAADLRYLD